MRWEGRDRPSSPARASSWTLAVLATAVATAAPAVRIDRWTVTPAFEPLEGTDPDRAALVSRGGPLRLLLHPSGIEVTPTRGLADPADARTIRLRLVGSRSDACLEPLDELPGRAHYFLGRDPGRWRTSVPRFARARYEGAFDGIDLVVHAATGRLELDVVVRPHTDPEQVVLELDGAAGLELDEAGRLLVLGGEPPLVLEAPVSYQVVDGTRRSVASRFLVLGPRRVGFEVGARDPGRALVIDPVLAYSTFLGGGEATTRPERARAVAVDGQGNAFVTGETRSVDFPTLDAAQPELLSERAAFVVGLAPDGTLLHATYLGGLRPDSGEAYLSGTVGEAIAVGDDGSIVVAGSTGSDSFPTTAGAFQTEHPFDRSTGAGVCGEEFGPLDLTGPCAAAFVAKLEPGGGSLAFATYVGGHGGPAPWEHQGTFAHGLALDPGTGDVMIVGETDSLAHPVAGALQPQLAPRPDGWPVQARDGFLTRLDGTGSRLLFSTYLGGRHDDVLTDVALGPAGAVHAAGSTCSSDFPVTAGAFQVEPAGDECGIGTDEGEAVVAVLSADGAALTHATYLGGASNERATAVAVGPDGRVIVAGYTRSTDFPLRGAFQDAHRGQAPWEDDGFVTALVPDLGDLAYSSYLGGSGPDRAWDLAVDAAGRVVVAGHTWSDDLPTVSPVPGLSAGPDANAFVARISADGARLTFAQTFGGASGAQGALATAVGPATGDLVVAGWTTAGDFPSVRAAQPDLHGPEDAFVLRIEDACALGSMRASPVERRLDTPLRLLWPDATATGTAVDLFEGTLASLRDGSPTGGYDHDTQLACSAVPAAGPLGGVVLLTPATGTTAGGHYYVAGCPSGADADLGSAEAGSLSLRRPNLAPCP